MQKMIFSSLNSRRLRLPLMIIVLAGLISGAAVHADQYSNQINALKAANNSAQASVSSLESQAGSYQAALSLIEDQEASLQATISANESRQTTVQAQIVTDQNNITTQKQLLGDEIRSLYIDGQMTTIEELATSKSLSDYVDKEAYNTVVQNRVDSLIDQVAADEGQLQQQKIQLSELIDAESQQNSQLQADQSQQQQLLSDNQSQQAAYNQQIQSNSSQISKLQAEQAAALAALEGKANYGGTGSYPWADAPCLPGNYGSSCGDYNWGYTPGDSVPLGAPADAYDPWGYEYRNCTSYVAWKISTTSTSPNIDSLISQLGNAAQWPGGAEARGLPVSYGSDPQVGDAAVDPGGGGWQGHVMYVEAVNGNGSIYVTQYNAGENGTYSTATISASEVNNLVFIQFPGM